MLKGDDPLQNIVLIRLDGITDLILQDIMQNPQVLPRLLLQFPAPHVLDQVRPAVDERLEGRRELELVQLAGDARVVL